MSTSGVRRPNTPSDSDDEVERVIMGQVGDKLVYANPKGQSFLEDMHEKLDLLIAKEETSQTKLSKHDMMFAEMDRRIASLEGRVRVLTQSSEGYLTIRRTFLEVYKRDIRGTEMTKGSKAIQEGNRIALVGDALGDAQLFQHDQRTDRALYRELYGLEYTQVLEYRVESDLTIFIESANADGCLFLVLNAYATIVAQGKRPSDKLKRSFDTFLTEVEESWLRSPTEDFRSPLGSAYYTFWDRYNQ
ncbi:MAG: hypothetical protein Q9167_006260 [Letrouitia subvulpina]